MRRLSTIVTLAAAGVLAHGLVHFTWAAVRHLRSPYSRDYGEGCVLAMVHLLHERGTYFTSLRDYPFVHGNYPPVFIALAWVPHALFGPSLLAPRLLSIVATAALIAVSFALLRRATRSSALAGAGAALLVAPWFVQTWAAMARVDMWACLFSVAGLRVALGDRDPRRAFPLFWLGFFTKQNALMAPAAVLLHFWLEGDRRRAARLTAAFVWPLAALFALLTAATGGEMYRHLVPYTAAAEYEWDRMAASYVDFARIAWPLLLVIAVAAARARERITAAPGRILLFYWLSNMAGLATIAKAGAAQNYFIEPWIATVLLAVYILGDLGAAARVPLLRAALVLLAAAAAHYTDGAARRLPPPIRHPERAQDFRELWEIVRTTPGPILSDNLAVLALHRREVLVEPFGMVLLTRTGLFRPDRIVADCEAGRFALIINEHRLEQLPGLQACLDRRYEAWKDLATYRLFRPAASAGPVDR